MKLRYIALLWLLAPIQSEILQAATQAKKPIAQKPAVAKKNIKRRIPDYYTEITSMDEYNRIVNSSQPSIIMYEAPWCTACTMMQPIFDQAAKKHLGSARFCSVNVDEDQFEHFLTDHEIQGLPTTLYCKNGKELKRERGCMETLKEIDNSIDQFKEILKNPPTEQPKKAAPKKAPAKPATKAEKKAESKKQAPAAATKPAAPAA